MRGFLAVVAALAIPVSITLYRNWGGLSRLCSEQVKLFEIRGSVEPLAVELANGTLRPGDPVEELLARHTSKWTIHDGRYTTLCFGPEPHDTLVVARDGRIVFARTHVKPPAHIYFDAFLPGESGIWCNGYNTTNSQRFYVSALAGCGAGQNHGRWEPTK